MHAQKRIGTFALLLALVVPLLVACGGGQPAAPAATTAPAAPAAQATTAPAAPAAPAAGGKIQVEDGAELRVSGWGDESEQKVNQDAFARFNQLYPNVKIKYEPQPKDFQTKMKADFAGNTEPDVFYLDSSLMSAFAPNELLLPLDDAMATAGVKGSDYLGQLTQLFQFGGKTYGLPKDQGALALFINDAMAQKAGVDPKSLTTFAAVTEAAKKMTAGEGPGKTFGMCVNEDIQRVAAFMLGNGNAVIADNKAVFNQEPGVQAVQWWLGFIKDGTGERPKNLGADWCGDAFSKGQAAMVVEGGWMIPFMANQAADVKYTAVPLPVGPNGKEPASLVFTNAWAASARTKYPQAAAALIIYLTSPENQKPILQTGFALPSHTSLLNDPYFAQNPNAKVLTEAAQYGKVADLLFGGVDKKEDVIKTMKEQAMEPIFLTSADVKASLDQAAQTVDQTLGQ
jgi:multiple sugar transport system substrate-binding protein